MPKRAGQRAGLNRQGSRDKTRWGGDKGKTLPFWGITENQDSSILSMQRKSISNPKSVFLKYNSDGLVWFLFWVFFFLQESRMSFHKVWQLRRWTSPVGYPENEHWVHVAMCDSQKIQLVHKVELQWCKVPNR